MQVGCFAGDPPRRDAEGTVDRINSLARVVRESGIAIYIQHTDAAEGLARGTGAWDLLESLDRSSQDLVVEKSACDAFLETELSGILKARFVTDLIIVGCATDFCVDTTVRTAAALGYTVTVPCDGHTTRDRPHLDAAKIIEHHNYMWTGLLLPRGKNVRLVTTANLLSELKHA